MKRAEAGDVLQVTQQLHHSHALSASAQKSYSGSGQTQGAALDGSLYKCVCFGTGSHACHSVYRRQMGCGGDPAFSSGRLNITTVGIYMERALLTSEGSRQKN